MPSIQELKEQREYYIGMIRNLFEKESEIQRQMNEYRQLRDYTEEEIIRKEKEECQLYSK